MKQDVFSDQLVMEHDSSYETFHNNVAHQRGLNFLSTVSHEIRTPLNAIIGISDLLRTKLSKEERDEYFDILKLTSENLLELVNNVLDFSKLQSDGFPILRKEFDLRKTLERSLFSQKSHAKANGVEFITDIDDKLPQILLGDPVKINQIVLNLVSNAIKFTEHGSVSLELIMQERSKEQVSILFLVRDTGIGIPPEQLKNIFQAFNQGGEDINQKYAGTGLGLSISNQLVELFGGELSVRSQMGKGSEFSFLLDFEIAPQTKLTCSNQYKTIKERVKGTKVLLAEDDKINTMVMEKYFERWKVDFVSVRNGKEAFDKVQEQDFDILLLDINMPVMNGFEAVRKIRALSGERFQNLPIVALTASSENFFQEEINESGMNDHVSKPFQPETLLGKIVELVNVNR